MKNRILWILSLLLIAGIPFCLADNAFYQDVMNKVQQDQNEYYEKMSNCISGNYPINITIFGVQDNICKSRLVSPIFTTNGVKYQIDNCNMPKDIFKSYINDIRDLTQEQYMSKWETTHDKYCKTEYRDNYQ